MKHLLKTPLFVIALAATGCLFYACSDEEISDVSPQEVDFTVRVKNGYLEFKDQAAFEQTKALLENQDDEALSAWESQFDGFTSLRSIDERAVDAQEVWFNQLRSMTEDERNALSQSDDDFWYSDYIKDHMSAFVLEDSGRFNLNVTAAASRILSLLNQDGVYKIGNEIYMHKDNSTKIIRDGDDSKIKMLAEIDKSDDDLQVVVFDDIIKPFKTGGENSREAINIVGNQKNNCGHEVGRDKVGAEAYIVATPIPGSGGFYTTAFYVLATNYYRDGLFGGYTRKRTRFLRIVGNLDLYVNDIYEGSSGDILVTTGGRLKTRISEYIDLANATANPPISTFVPQITGTLNIFGRNGTLCGDSAPLPQDKWY